MKGFLFFFCYLCVDKWVENDKLNDNDIKFMMLLK